MRKTIYIPDRVREEICKAFGCSRMMVWRALNFMRDTELSLRIRAYAMEKGGVLLLSSPAEETIHDSNGIMTQYFANGAVLEADKNTGTVRVRNAEGELLRTMPDCSITELYAAQDWAARL